MKEVTFLEKLAENLAEGSFNRITQTKAAAGADCQSPGPRNGTQPDGGH